MDSLRNGKTKVSERRRRRKRFAETSELVEQVCVSNGRDLVFVPVTFHGTEKLGNSEETLSD